MNPEQLLPPLLGLLLTAILLERLNLFREYGVEEQGNESHPF